MKTHTLRVVTADGPDERKVDGTEGFVLRSAGAARSWRLKELATVSLNGSGTLYLGYANGTGEYRNLRPADRLELGGTRFAVHELVSFELAEIPKPPKVAPHEQPVSRTLRIPYRDPSRVPDVVTFTGEARIQGELVRERDFDEPVIFSARLDEVDVAGIQRIAP